MNESTSAIRAESEGALYTAVIKLLKSPKSAFCLTASGCNGAKRGFKVWELQPTRVKLTMTQMTSRYFKPVVDLVMEFGITVNDMIELLPKKRLLNSWDVN